MDKISKAITATVVFLYGVVMAGVVFSYNWEWFVATVFDVQLINIAHAIGLAFFVKVATLHFSLVELEATKLCTTSEADKFVIKLLFPLVLLLIGWVIHLATGG
jgi:hypothetical protein